MTEETSVDTKNTVTFKRSHLYAALLPLAFVLGLSVGFLFWGRDAITGSAPRAAAPPGAAAPQSAQPGESVAENVPQDVKRYDVPVDDDPFYGPQDAPITIIEFSDYECPFCTKWHNEVWPRIQADYPDQVRLVYRDFPLAGLHENATAAAEAAHCAGEQGAYWEYHGALFENQHGLSASAYETYASEIGLDPQAFDECLESHRYQEEIEADYEFAANLGVRSTPTFFVNGIAVVGAQPYEVFQEVIDLELAGQIP